MPQDIVGAASWLNRYTLPLDEELADVESVKRPFQRLADNAAFLADAVFGSGVHALRRVADVAALKALAAPAEGGACVVSGLGLYVFAAASAVAELVPWVVAPAAGPGRWVHILAALRDVAGGFAMLDAGARVPAAHVPNMLVGSASALGAGTHSTNATAVAVEVTLPDLRAGDRVFVDAFFEARPNPAGMNPGPGDYTSVLLEGTNLTNSRLGGIELLDARVYVRAIHTVAVAAGAGPVRVTLSLDPGAMAVPADVLPGASLRAIAFRP